MPFPGHQHEPPREAPPASKAQSWTAAQEHAIGARLTQNLGPEFISHRQSGGGRVGYVEGWRAINLANDTFGFNGWSSEIREMVVDYCDELSGGRYSMGVSVTVRITLKDGAYREDVGYGTIENVRGKNAAYDKCRKEATTDAIKRALRQFGNAMGNCLYNSAYTKQVMKVKQEPFVLDRDNLLRDMTFQDQYHSKFSYGKEVQNPVESKDGQSAKPAQPPPKVKQEPSYVHRQAPSAPPPEAAPSRADTTEPLLDPDSIARFEEPKEPKALVDQFYDDADFEDEFMQDAAFDTNPDKPTAATKTAEPPQAQPVPKEPTPPSDFMPNTPIKFFKASAATALQQNSPVATDLQFDASFISPGIRRTLPHNKSVPIKRSDVMGAQSTAPSASLALAPSHAQGNPQAPPSNTSSVVQASKAPIQSPVRPYGAPRRPVGQPLGRPSRLASPRLGSPAPESSPEGDKAMKRPMADQGPSVANVPVSTKPPTGLKVGETSGLPVDKKQRV